MEFVEVTEHRVSMQALHSRLGQTGFPADVSQLEPTNQTPAWQSSKKENPMKLLNGVRLKETTWSFLNKCWCFVKAELY